MIGEMRDRLTIQNRGTSQDSFGATQETWLDQGERWGKVQPLSSREMWFAQQVQSDVTHKVTLRYFEGLSTQHRFRVAGRILEIASVTNPDGRKRFHECTCVERT